MPADFKTTLGTSGKLVIDFSAIGIPTTNNSYAVSLECDSMNMAGLKTGDVLLIENVEPQTGTIVLGILDEQLVVRRYTSADGKQILHTDAGGDSIVDDSQILGPVVGLIRRL